MVHPAMVTATAGSEAVIVTVCWVVGSGDAAKVAVAIPTTSIRLLLACRIQVAVLPGGLVT